MRVVLLAWGWIVAIGCARGDTSYWGGEGGTGGDAAQDAGRDTYVPIDVQRGTDVTDISLGTDVVDVQHGTDVTMMVDTGHDTGASCPGGETRCGASCVSLASDRLNCGACGNACGAGMSCSGGACSCGAGFTSCFGSCVNTTSDPSNCGTCGVVCAAGATCTAGACSGSASDPCAINTDCLSCTLGSTCGWCISTGGCHTGTVSGASDGACGGTNWAWSFLECP